MEHGFYCEAITLSESIIADRLDSRLSYLKQHNCGFRMLGELVRETTNKTGYHLNPPNVMFRSASRFTAERTPRCDDENSRV